MIVRKFVVDDMHEGITRIRQDMGREAIILSQRPMRVRGPLGWLQKERLEVYAAADEADIRTHVQSAAVVSVPVEPIPASPATPGKETVYPFAPRVLNTSAPDPMPDPTKLNQATDPEPDRMVESTPIDPAELIQPCVPAKATGIASPAGVAFHSQDAGTSERSDDPMIGWFEKLLDEDVHHQVAKSLMEEANVANEADDLSWQQQLNQLIHDKISQRIHHGLLYKKQQKARIMLAGPSGCGKTTAVIKLAGQLIHEHGLSVGLISADFLRAGAHLQLKAYATILNAPMVCLHGLAEAKAALIQLSYCDLILIDTPGCNLAYDDQQTMTRQMIHLFRPDQVFVCVSASAGFRAAGSLLTAYRDLCDYSLIITRMDETETRGSILNIASMTDKPIAYLTDGPAVSCPPDRPDAAAIARALTSARTR